MRLLFFRSLFLVSCFFCLIFIVRFYGLTSYLSLAWLQENVHYLQLQVQQRYWHVVLVYLVSYITASACALPGSTIFIIAAGLLFGIVSGIVIAMIGLVIGATLLFLFSRYVFGDWIQQRYQQRFTIFNRAVARDGYYYMVVARMLAVVPFGFLNILAGITLLPLQTFMWTTAIGMLPYIVLYVFAGQQFGNIQASDTVFSSPMIFFISTIMFRISLIPMIVRYIIKTRRKGFSS